MASLPEYSGIYSFFFFLKVIFVKIIVRQSKNTCSFFLMPTMINRFNALQFVFCFNEENALRFFLVYDNRESWASQVRT